MIEDESEVFEITDFTTASEWERFIARLEEIIHEWKLSHQTPTAPLAKGQLTNGVWTERVEHLQFADFKFIITRHCLKDVLDAEEATEAREGSIESNSDQSRDDLSRQDGPELPEGGVPGVWQDMMSVENDFPSRAHCLSRWYGLRDFVVIAPDANMEDIGSESRANLVLSSVAIALSNTTCQIPVFIHVHQKWRRLYYGQCEVPGFRTAFEMVHLRSIPHQFSHLAGLLDVFKGKIASPVSPTPPVTVGVRFTYVLQDWTHYSWTQQPPDFDVVSGGEVGFTEYGDLPFGACEDPVTELHLSTTWATLSEEMIVDNDIYSDLDPLQAPLWSARIKMMDQPQCLLGDYLSMFVELCRRQESTDQLLGKHMLDPDNDLDMDVSQALSRLTDHGPYSIPTIGNVVTRATSKLPIKPEEAPIPSDLLNVILVFLFPDAKSDSEASDCAKTPPGSAAATPCREELPAIDKESQKLGITPSPSMSSSIGEPYGKEVFKQFKSSAPESLTYRLAVCMCIVNHSHGGLKAVAHLWQEFVLEMRFRWENNYALPDLDPGPPNMGCSLIHQKLQMLNCCIERKKARESLQEEGGERQRHSSDEADSKFPPSPRSLSSLSSEEEFFECSDTGVNATSAGAVSDKLGKEQRNLRKKLNDEMCLSDDMDAKVESKPDDISQEEESSISRDISSVDLAYTDSLTHRPEGRRAPYLDYKLLNMDDLMYIPITQEPSPMTEDMLEEHAEVLAKLGTSAEGAHLRARMQSACLLSDMEAFKAANPGCNLGDFVRWYSPRDWVETEVLEADGQITTKHQLSQRMQIPGNMWVEVWLSAKPVPARRQRRLFDDTKEAEKVLHWLAALKPGDVALRLMPMLIHASINKVLEQEEAKLPVVKKMAAQITDRATKAMRAPKMEIKRFEDLVRQLTKAEILVTRAQSLLTKFSQEKQDLDINYRELQEFVTSFLEQNEVSILGASRGPLGNIIHRLFVVAQKSAYLLPEEEGGEEEDKPNTAIPDFPSPVGREYVLRTSVRRPSPWSRESPQRMYCVLQKDDFRLAGAFTSDTTFQ